MIVLSTTVVILSIAVWIWVEVGNQADRKAHAEELQQLHQIQANARLSTTGATEANKGPPAFGRLSGGEPPRGGPAAGPALNTGRGS
ncbi:hypothetical protein HXX76_007390 [Chlamydomonas incerta]|uniref:Uncharacterized protein n=1 Tax=Chlamydomonas incerta TaxID=51695 RepID=A0A835TAG7_CHLIN|nr:hypothetical protein HXX76_007390 [Chlamydomonas incerta]|eukprot:KAG2435315.1 hypothetical protein HXX76_007390 [Chlamydomonas incerta]